MIKRGEVYCCKLYGVGSVQQDYRPCLVVSNNKANKYSPVITVLPITSRKKRPLPTHVPITLNVESCIMAEQVITIDKTQVSKYVTTLNQDTMSLVDIAMQVQLSIQQDLNNNLLLQQLKECYSLLQELNVELEEEKEKVKILLGSGNQPR